MKFPAQGAIVGQHSVPLLWGFPAAKDTACGHKADGGGRCVQGVVDALLA